MVNEFKVITVMNDAMIKTLKDKGANCDLNIEIKELLRDESLFFKIKREYAYKILLSVGVHRERLEDVYKKLISPNLFYSLLQRGIIKKDDTLIVKYDSFGY